VPQGDYAAALGASDPSWPQPMTEKTIICDAIRQRLLLEFRYGGLPRVVEPYVHGVSTRGVEVLRAVQVGGSSNSGSFGFGKLWTVDEISALRITAETFPADDPNYDPNDSGMQTIHCCIEREPAKKE
jgi:hypothetical protein